MARGKTSGCNAKEGNPFGPFWDTFDVDFTHSEFYGPLNYDVHHQNMASQWNKKYPPNQWPGKYIDQFLINYNAYLIENSVGLHWSPCQLSCSGREPGTSSLFGLE